MARTPKDARPKGDKATRDKPKRGARLKEIVTAFNMTRRQDRRLVPYMLAAWLGPVAVFVLVGVLTTQVLYFSAMGVVTGLLLATVVFGRRATSAAFAQIEGKPGASLGILQNMRGDWRVTPVAAATTTQDMVHRVLGRPGVILVGEGSARRVRQLLGQEKKRLGRIVGDTPVYDLIVGDDEGQVPLRRLQNHLVKLPRNITPKQVNALDTRLQALGGMNVPLPKGPMPKGARLPRGAKTQRPR